MMTGTRGSFVPLLLLLLVILPDISRAYVSKSGLFVEREGVCGAELAWCSDATSCFDEITGACQNTTAIVPEYCHPIMAFCKPCYPFSQCGGGLDATEGTAQALNDNHTNETTMVIPLEDPECLPYRIRVQNRYGKIAVVSCEFTEGEFPFARPIPGEDHRYQCCTTGPSMPPFVQDGVFYATVYPILVMYCLAAVNSLVVIVGLTVPLLVQLRKGTKPLSSRRRGGGVSRYSTYNLYLVYLAVPDFLYAVFRIGLEGSMIDHNFYINFHSHTVLPTNILSTGHDTDGPAAWAYTIANLWLNAIVSYEVLQLLRSSQRARKTNQPSLRRVSLQAGTVYLGMVLYMCVSFYLLGEIRSAPQAKGKVLFEIYWYSNLLMYLLPIGYVVFVTVLVLWRGYIRDRAMRELFFYYFRIVAVFIGIWIPGVILAFYTKSPTQEWAWAFALSAPAIQSLATTGVMLTKSDVRKYLRYLVTGSYCRKGLPLEPSSGLAFPPSSMNLSFSETHSHSAEFLRDGPHPFGRAGSSKSFEKSKEFAKSDSHRWRSVITVEEVSATATLDESPTPVAANHRKSLDESANDDSTNDDSNSNDDDPVSNDDPVRGDESSSHYDNDIDIEGGE